MEWEFDCRYPATSNHTLAVRRVRLAVQEVLGAAALAHDQPPAMGAEDFSFYLQRVPGAMFFLGASAAGAGPGLHTSAFDFNDELLSPGVSLFLHLVQQVSGCVLAAHSASE